MSATALHKAKWRARRGMRELDVLLNRFIDAHYADLDPTERAHFDAFLQESDVDLYAWFTHRASPANDSYEKLVKQILSVGE